MSKKGKPAATSRLRVRREVVRNLSAEQLGQVAGGIDLVAWMREVLNGGEGRCRESAVAQ